MLPEERLITTGLACQKCLPGFKVGYLLKSSIKNTPPNNALFQPLSLPVPTPLLDPPLQGLGRPKRLPPKIHLGR